MCRRKSVGPRMEPWETPASHPVKILTYIKCYSSSRTRPVKSPQQFYQIQLPKDLQLIKKKTYWKSQKRLYFSRWSTILLFTSFSKNLLTTERLIQPPMKPSNNLENKTPSDTYWRVQLVWKKVQAHSSWEPQVEYNQDQMPLTNQGLLWPF